MRNARKITAVFLIVFSYSFSILTGLAAAEPPGSRECTESDNGKDGLCGHAQAMIAQFEREKFPTTKSREAYADTNVTHCFLDIEITLNPNTVTGSNTMDVTSLTDGLTEFTVDLFSDMTVDVIYVNGSSAGYIRPTDQIIITLDRTYNTDESFQVEVVYHGSPYHLSAAAGYSGTHGSPAVEVVASHSQPYNSPAWWPCKEDIADKFTMDMWVTTPDWMTLASNGLLQGVDPLTGNRHRTRWHESYPISVYLVSIAATNYTMWTEYYVHDTGSMPVEFYIYPEDVSWVQPLVADMVTMIETLSGPDVFGEYPFLSEKYGIAQFEGCCGMEHQTITSQGSFPERRNVHELAHMWWGDSITCKTWHDIWLNEGFARYAESLWHEFKPGGSWEAYMTHMQTYRPSSYGGTVYRYDISTSSQIFDITNSYNKGSWVMHMLRHVVGDINFFGILAAHRQAHEGRAADTPEFQAVAEYVFGQDLSWFFDEWIYGPGAPAYEYGWTYRANAGQHLLLLHVEQTQTSYPNFKMPIDVTITYAGGTTETQAVWHEDDIQWYVLSVSQEVIDVELDKYEWILRSSLQEVAYLPNCSDPFADLNLDGYVDLTDYAAFQSCFTGTATGYDSILCGCFDRDADDDIDADDYTEFAACLAGPSAPADITCDDPQITLSFSDDFDSDTSGQWQVATSGSDTSVVFAYDYSADGIPSAPNSSDGTTLGAKFQANMVSPQATEAITIFPKNTWFAGRYTLTFDMWINANGPFPAGGTGSTEFITCGIGADPGTVNLHEATGSGGWFAADGEGGASHDYRAYKNQTEQWIASGQFHVSSNNNTDAQLSAYFNPQTPPLLQQTTYPQQSGATTAGCMGFAWHRVEVHVDQTAGTATWIIDDLPIATLDTAVGSSFDTSGTIAIGYMDPYTSISDNAALSFGIIDNVEVVTID